MSERPINEVLDDLIPDWREVARRMASEGSTNEEIVAEFDRRMAEEIDVLLDFYNDLGRS